MKLIVVLSGAGMSAESGINTFRDAEGLWEGHDVMEVVTPEGFQKNPDLVYEFYNQRRRQLFDVLPNEGHRLLSDLEDDYNVSIVTQNVDDLHERAGSTNVVHLHGELRKVRSIVDEEYIVDWDSDLSKKDKDSNGYAMRPHIVWFGEAVPMLDKAVEIVSTADVVVIIGTSLQVYPAASLMHYVSQNTPIYYIDKNPASVTAQNIEVITKPATIGVNKAISRIKNKE